MEGDQIIPIRNLPGRYTAFCEQYYSEELGILIVASDLYNTTKTIRGVRVVDRKKTDARDELLILEINDSNGSRMVPYWSNKGFVT